MSVEASAVHSGESEQVPRQRAEQIRAFQGHAGVFIVGMAVVFGVNLVTNLTAGIAGILVGLVVGVGAHRMERGRRDPRTRRLAHSSVPPC